MTTLHTDADPVLREMVDRLLNGHAGRVVTGRVIGAWGNPRDGVTRLHPMELPAIELPAALEPGDGRRPDLLLADLTGSAIDAYEALPPLRLRVPGARLVVLEERLSILRLRAALRAGVRGYLLTDIAPDALIQSLRLVLAGETVLPTRLADLLRNGGIAAADLDPSAGKASLSWRDTDLLHGLQTGKSIRGIAADLRISETEARATLRGLLRRLNLSNRTQAAIWAANNGIRPVEGRAD